jgi:hypothetical protein
MRTSGLICKLFILAACCGFAQLFGQSLAPDADAEWESRNAAVKAILCDEYSEIVRDDCNPTLSQSAQLPDGRLIGLFNVGGVGAYADQMAFLQIMNGKVEDVPMSGMPGKKGTMPDFLSGSSVRHSANVDMSKDGRVISAWESETEEDERHVHCLSAYVFEWSTKSYRYEYSKQKSIEFRKRPCG